MHPVIQTTSILLYISGLTLLIGGLALAREVSTGAHKKHPILVAGILMYLVASGLAWGWQGSLGATGKEPSLFALGGLICAMVGWVAIFIIVGTAALRRRLSMLDSSRRHDIVMPMLYISSSMAILAVSFVRMWADWEPWKHYLQGFERVTTLVTLVAFAAFALSGWRMVVSIFTTGKVPDEFKV